MPKAQFQQTPAAMLEEQMNSQIDGCARGIAETNAQSHTEVKAIRIQMATCDSTGRTLPVEVSPPLNVDTMRKEAIKKFRGKVSKQSRVYHGVTGDELHDEVSSLSLTDGFVIWSSSGKAWKGAERIKLEYLRAQQSIETKLTSESEPKDPPLIDWTVQGGPIPQELLDVVASNRGEDSDEVVLCWKDTDKNGYLTNWAKVPMIIEGTQYNCVEQWIMANKATLCGDEAARDKVMTASSPSVQQRIGRALDLDKRAWNNEAKFQVQLEGVRAKFRHSISLAARLLATGVKPIAEASPDDRVFGIGIAPSDKDAQDPSKWGGQNLLGKALMQVRDELRQSVLARVALPTYAVQPLRIELYTFGFENGPRLKAGDTDHIFDCRCIENPSKISRKGRTGLDKRLRDEVLRTEGCEDFIRESVAHILRTVARRSAGPADALQTVEAEHPQPSGDESGTDEPDMREKSEPDADEHFETDVGEQSELDIDESDGAPEGCRCLISPRGSHKLIFGFGCAAGQHRSVSVCVEVARRLGKIAKRESKGFVVNTLHLNIH